MSDNNKEKWRDLGIRDKLSYSTAIGLIVSGIVMGFLSFFLHEYNIETGVLIYIAQCFVVGGSLLGASVYFRSKWLEFNTQAKHDIRRDIEEEVHRAMGDAKEN